jgi:hypothetical protein
VRSYAIRLPVGRQELRGSGYVSRKKIMNIEQGISNVEVDSSPFDKRGNKGDLMNLVTRYFIIENRTPISE